MRAPSPYRKRQTENTLNSIVEPPDGDKTMDVESEDGEIVEEAAQISPPFMSTLPLGDKIPLSNGTEQPVTSSMPELPRSLLNNSKIFCGNFR